MPDLGVLSPRVHRTDRRYRRILFKDAIEHGIRWLGGNSQSKSLEDVREAVLAALEELAHYRRWRYWTKWGRIILDVAQTTGTVAYTHSTRSLTLTGATWPTGAERAHVKVGDVICKVDKRTSSTVLRLDPQLNPGQDVASGASYTYCRAVYDLPPDFLSLDCPENEDAWWAQNYVRAGDMVALHRYGFSTGPSFAFNLRGEPSSFGGMAIEFHSVHDTGTDNRTMDFAYVAMPYPLTVDGMLTQDKAGTVALTSGSATVAGSSTEFKSVHNGSVLRVSRNAQEPTGVEGNNRYDSEFTVETRDSDSQLTLVDDDLPTATVSGRGYIISDQVDIAHYMNVAFLRGIEWQLAQSRNMAISPKVYDHWQLALRQAATVDGNMVFQRRSAGEGPLWTRRLGVYGATPTDAGGP